MKHWYWFLLLKELACKSSKHILDKRLFIFENSLCCAEIILYVMTLFDNVVATLGRRRVECMNAPPADVH